MKKYKYKNKKMNCENDFEEVKNLAIFQMNTFCAYD